MWMNHFDTTCLSPDKINVEQWDLSVCGALAPHVFQSYAWGDFRRQSGWQVMYLVSSADKAHCALALALLRGFGIPGVRILYIPRGPLIYDTASCEQEREFRSALQYIKQVAHESKVIWAKVSPDIEADRVWAKRALEEGLSLRRVGIYSEDDSIAVFRGRYLPVPVGAGNFAYKSASANP